MIAKLIATIPDEQLWWIREVDGVMEVLGGFRDQLRAVIAEQAFAWSA